MVRKVFLLVAVALLVFDARANAEVSGEAAVSARVSISCQVSASVSRRNPLDRTDGGSGAFGVACTRFAVASAVPHAPGAPAVSPINDRFFAVQTRRGVELPLSSDIAPAAQTVVGEVVF